MPITATRQSICLENVLPLVYHKVRTDLSTHLYNCSFYDPKAKGTRESEKIKYYYRTDDEALKAAEKMNIGAAEIPDGKRNGEQYMLFPFNGKNPLFISGFEKEFSSSITRRIQAKGGSTFHPTSKGSFSPIYRNCHIAGGDCFISDLFLDVNETIESQYVQLKNCKNVLVLGSHNVTISDCSDCIIICCENSKISNQHGKIFMENTESSETEVQRIGDYYRAYDFSVSIPEEEKLANALGVSKNKLGELFDRMLKEDPALIERLMMEGGAEITVEEIAEQLKKLGKS